MKLDILAIGVHPDDIELSCGGTVASHIWAGKKVGLLDLTRGELGTRGSAELRDKEAAEAAKILGATLRLNLQFKDGFFTNDQAHQLSIISVLRTYQPDIVLAPALADRHPDHGRAHHLVHSAAFYSGLRRRGTRASGEPHRPAALFHFMQHDIFEPTFVVDVSSTWSRKLAALEAYSSQLYRPGDTRREPTTKVSSREFSLAIEGRARHFGQSIGAEFGEPFGSRGPLAVADLWQLRPTGLR